MRQEVLPCLLWPEDVTILALSSLSPAGSRPEGTKGLEEVRSSTSGEAWEDSRSHSS